MSILAAEKKNASHIQNHKQCFVPKPITQTQPGGLLDIMGTEQLKSTFRGKLL